MQRALRHQKDVNVAHRHTSDRHLDSDKREWSREWHIPHLHFETVFNSCQTDRHVTIQNQSCSWPPNGWSKLLKDYNSLFLISKIVIDRRWRGKCYVHDARASFIHSNVFASPWRKVLPKYCKNLIENMFFFSSYPLNSIGWILAK